MDLAIGWPIAWNMESGSKVKQHIIFLKTVEFLYLTCAVNGRISVWLKCLFEPVSLSYCA
jgi:hypothetical protein